MSVKKIFMTLIVIVMCVILGAFLINIFLPNVTTVLINAAEMQIYNATGMKLDFNRDGVKTGSDQIDAVKSSSVNDIAADGTVGGFNGGAGGTP